METEGGMARSPGNLDENKNRVWLIAQKVETRFKARHAPAITTVVNDISPLSRRAASNLIALGQDVAEGQGENGRGATRKWE